MFDFLSRRLLARLPSVSHASAKAKPIRRSQRARIPLWAERLEDRINPNTTLNPLNGGLQIVIAGGETVNLSTTSGKLSVSDSTPGQTIIDTTAKFTLAGPVGNTTAKENAALTVDFTSITITGTGTGGGQTVNFAGGSFVATNVNDGTISTVVFSGAPSSFSGDLNVLSGTSLTISAPISGSDALNIIVGGTNAALNVNASITSQYGPVTLQATGDLAVGMGVAIVSTTDVLSLGADLTPAGTGDDGVGTLSIGAGASVFGTSVNLRAAGVNIDPSATVGQAMATEAVVSTFVDNTHGLNGPTSVLYEAGGSLYVSNSKSTTVSEVSPTGLVSTFATVYPYQHPYCLAYNGSLYVDASGVIYRVNAFGTLIPFAFGSCQSMVLDSQGNLYIATGTEVLSFPPDGSRPGEIPYGQVPVSEGLAFDQAGDLYISNGAYTHRGDKYGTIERRTPTGVVTTFVDTNQRIANPGTIEFDNKGNLYMVADNSLDMATPSGQVRHIPLFKQNSNGQFSNDYGGQIGSLSFDGTSAFYFADSAANTIQKLEMKAVVATTSRLTIRTSLPSLPMTLGGSTASSGLWIPSASLPRLITTASGTVLLGDSSQTGNIQVITATPATTPGASTVILQSATSEGQIILDDGDGTDTALNGNGGNLSIIAGTGGIVAANANNGSAEIANTGATITLDTTGPIGTNSKRIQIGDSVSPTSGIMIGTTNKPSAVYLDGLGTITLGMVLGSPGATIDVTARTNLVVAKDAVIVSRGDIGAMLSLGADLNPAGEGDDGVGTLIIGAGATVYGARINLRGADISIDPTAIVGDLQYTPAVTIAVPNRIRAMTSDNKGDVFTVNEGSPNTVSEYYPGSTSPDVTFTGVDYPGVYSDGVRALAVDSIGNLYVANIYRGVFVFAPGSTTPTKTIGVPGPFSLGIDNQGDLFVASAWDNSNHSPSFVSEFLPGASSPIRTFGSFSWPTEMLVGSSGNVYVTNITINGSVANRTTYRFAPGSNTGVVLNSSLEAAMAEDAKGNLFVSNGKTVSEYAPGTINPTVTLTGLTSPGSMAFDSRGNIYVCNFAAGVQKFELGATTPAPIPYGDQPSEFPVFDNSDNLYVYDFSHQIEKFIFNQPLANSITIRSSLPSRPMGIGGTDNAAVPGINLTSNELAHIFTAANGSITFGDSTQTGNITFTTATPATTAGAATVVVQSGDGQIILDDGGSASAALNGNGGSVTLTSGTGGIVDKAANLATTADISNATGISLTSTGTIGSSGQPAQLTATTLTTNTSTSNGNQFLSALGTVNASSLNAGSGTITLTGTGTFKADGSIMSAVILNGGILTGDGTTAAVTVNSATVQPGDKPGSLQNGNLSLGAASTFIAQIGGTTAGTGYSQDIVTGTVNLGGATLNLQSVNNFVPAPGQNYILIANDSIDPVVGTFAGLPEGAVISNFLGTHYSATITYAGGDGNDVVLKVIDTFPTNHFQITAPSSAPLGTPVSFTITALDQFNDPTGSGYTGTVHFLSTDGSVSLPVNDVALTNGTGTFSVTFKTAASQTLSATDRVTSSIAATSSPIAVSAPVLSGFLVNAIGGNTVTAGSAFIVTVQAADQFGKPRSDFSGPVSLTTTDPQVATLPTMTLSNGFGVSLADLKTVANGPWTITATSGTLQVTSAPITVTPANAVYFKVATPSTAITNTTFPITVTALDAFNNVVPNYAGTVKLSSTDNAAARAGVLGTNYTFTTGAGQDNGVHTFNVQLLTSGAQKITVADTTATVPGIVGTSGAVTTSRFTVTALTKTPTGFSATFNEPINPADLTIYGKGTTQQDVLLVGKNTNNGQPYPGTLIVDASKRLVTFNVSSSFLVASNPGGSAALPDDTYIVTLLSGVGNNGFQDVSGQGLDDAQGGHADYIGTFTTTYQHDKTAVLGIPDFARGPNAPGDITTLVQVANDPYNGGHVGIPITIYNASNLTSAGFTLTYNANILTLTGGRSDWPNLGATFQMMSNVMSADGIHSVATFAFSDATPISGTQILGDIKAYVPYSARNQYQVKDLVALDNITVNGGASVVPANAVDVDAYFGDVNGDHHLDGLDKALIANVASTVNTGFTAFTLLDPAIIGDVSGDNAVTANSTSLLSNYLLGKTAAKIPALPNPAIADNLFTSPFAADPTLSLPASIQTDASGVANLPIYLDHPRPAGSTGLVEAELTLTYDPAVLSVSAADITLGSIPSQGTGWQLAAMVNAATGQITVQLYSQTPITSDQAGSLVNITFHLKPSAGRAGKTTVQLLDSQSVLADAQAAMILSPGLDWTAVLIGI